MARNSKDKMTDEAKLIIEEILKELGYKPIDNDIDNPSRPRFNVLVCDENEKRNIYFNIPKNVNFVFQLIFENGSIEKKLRDLLADCLRKNYGGSYDVGGGKFGGEYLTIYLPSKSYIAINIANKGLIKKLIKEEIIKVCECYKKLKEKGIVS